jgi:hypothetical protein
LSAFGFSFASAISSFTVETPTLGCTVSMNGLIVARLTGAKSRSVSYGIFAWRFGLIVSGPGDPRSSV